MVFRSLFPDVDVPDVPLATFVLERAGDLGTKPALVDGPTGDALTYGELAAAVRRAAAGLAARGLRKGDVVAIYAPNSPDYAVALLAVAAAGGVATTVNPLFTAKELEAQLADAKTRFLVTVPPLLKRTRDASVEETFVLGGSFSELDGPDVPAPAITPSEDVVVLPYSSGTTGLPKGVMLTHRNVVANLCQIAPNFRVHGDLERIVAIGVLPFFHIYGMVVLLAHTLRHGGTLVTMPRFDLDEFLRLLETQAITHAYVVPPIILGLAKHPSVDRYDLSQLEVVMSGAAPLGADLQRACSERVNSLLVQGYGMTEASPVTHLTPFGEELLRPGSVGPPVASTECRIVDPETGAELGPDEQGEVLVRGPQVMKGYLDRPDDTAATVDADGWLHTGDVGVADADGYLTLVDRVKELIKYKGYQVAPAELEATLVTHPAVADAAVVASPDEEAGEVPVAYVVAGGDVTADAIAAYVAERVAPYKKLRRVELVDEIPKSPSGKILRRILIERERTHAAD